MHVLGMIYSWPFWIGSAITAVLWKIYCWQRAHWLDRHYPLPAGRRHYVAQIDRVWLAGLVLALSLGYILLTAQKTQDQTIALTKRVGACWAESYQSTKAQITLNAQNDLITRQQQGLQRDYDRATSDWLKDLIRPPGPLANEETTSPARQQWGIEVTIRYQERLNQLGARYDELVVQRQHLDTERNAHPLPEVTCGK